MIRIGIMILSVLTIGTSAPVVGQNTLHIYEKALKAHTLAGIVRVGHGGEGAQGVLVEKCSEDWNTVMASTLTDEQGHFAFPRATRKGFHYLRLSGPGITTVLVKVKICRSAPQELSITIPFST